MSAPLSADALALLDFLCATKAKGVRITGLKTPALMFRLERLQDAGLVKWHTFEPTGWALSDWANRQRDSAAAPIALEPVEEPPQPMAGSEGGGAAAEKGEAPPLELDALDDAQYDFQPVAEHDAPVGRAAVAEDPNEPPPPKSFFLCGHERTPKNTLPKKNRCRECQLAYAAKYIRNKRAAAKANKPVELPPPPTRFRCGSCDAPMPTRKLVCDDCRIILVSIGRLARFFNRDRTPRQKAPPPPPKCAPPKVREPAKATGAELAALLEAWCLKTGASKTRLAIHLFNSGNGISQLHKSGQVWKSTEAKVRDFLAAPCDPNELPQRAPQGRPQRATAEGMLLPERFDPEKERLRQLQANNRRKETTRAKARKLLAAGQTPSMKVNRDVRSAMNEITQGEEQHFRATDPVEVAKTLIRSRGIRCFDAVVYDGETKGKGFYYINRDRVNEAALLAYADRLRPVCR